MERPKIGLVLSGGGAKGFAHIGVIKTFENHKIPIDIITGVSAGSLFGGIYASGTSIQKIEKSINEINKPSTLRRYMFEPSLDGGIIGGKKILNLIDHHLTKKKIEDFPIKFGCTAVDLMSEKTVNFVKGDAKTAIRASISVPGVFKPVNYDKMVLVDGGIRDPLPINLAKELGAEVMIVSDVTGNSFKKNDRMSIIRTLVISVFIMQKEVLKRQLETNTDIVLIKPNIGKTFIFDFGDQELAKSLIKEGQRATKEKMEEIKGLLGY